MSIYGVRGNNAVSGPKFHLRKTLIFSVLFLLVITPKANSQISNRLAYETILIGHLKSDTNKVGKFTGFLPELTKAHGKQFPASKKELNVEVPSVEFLKLEDKEFQRTISIDLVYKDSSEQRVGLTKIDTLSKSDLPAARNVEEKALRGADPRFVRKFLIPFAGIGGGIAGIISLFYIRSSQQ